MKSLASLMFIVFLVACNNAGNNHSKKDSIITKSDTTLKIEDVDCYDNFFMADKKDSTNYMLVLKGGKKILMNDFVAANYSTNEDVAIIKKDVDRNGIEELWLRSYTGGAHCCDEWFVFIEENNSYKQVAQLTTGDICVSNEIFTFDFSQMLGYFKTCFACGFEDIAKGFVPMRSIQLKYNKEKFEIIKYAEADEKQLLKNLEILQQHGFEPISEDKMDSGWRKEFAMNFAVYYFNHNKDWKATKLLFDKYYTFKDATSISKELKVLLDFISTRNSF